jgi:hypothetical protein
MDYQSPPAASNEAAPWQDYAATTQAQPEKPGVMARLGAGLAGIGAGAAEMLGLGGPVEVAEYAAGRQPQQHLPVAGPFGATAEQVRSVEQQMHGVTPATVAKGAVQGVVQPFKTIAGAFNNAPQTLGQAYDVGKAVPQAAATLEMGAGGLKAAGSGIARGAEAVSKIMPTRPVAQIVKEGRAAGYSFKPSEASALTPGGTAYAGRTAEGVVGSPRLSIETAIKNQEITNKLANKDLGIPDNVKLTPAKIRELKEPHNAVYKEVGELGSVRADDTYINDITNLGRAPGKSFTKVKNPDIETLREQYLEPQFDAQDTVLQIRTLRRNGGKNLKNLDAAKNELGYAQRQVADALEAQLERHAEAIGKPDLVQRFQNSRRELAKINNVSEALNAATGDVSAAKVSKLLKGTNYNGNLQLVRDMHDAFPSEMRDARKLRNKVPLTKLEAAIGATPVVGGMLLHNPLLAAAALPVMAAPNLTRKFLLSEAYQNRLAPGPSRLKAKPPTLKDRPVRKAAKTVGRSQYLTIPITKGQQDLQEQPQ